MLGGGEKYYIQTQNLFEAVHSYNEKEKFSELSKKVNSIKLKSQDRRGNNVSRTKKMQKPQL